MRWDLVARICEGGYLTPWEIMKIWTLRTELEEYQEKMLYSSASVLLSKSAVMDLNAKQFKDAIAVKAHQLIEEAFNLLDERSRQLWKWRYDYDIQPAFIGQQLLNAEEQKRVIHIKEYCERKANKFLVHIAENIAENIVLLVKTKKVVKTEPRQ